MIVLSPDEPNFGKVQLYIQQLTTFLHNYTWILDAYVSDFYFKKHWEKLPIKWQSRLSDWSTEELSFLLDRHPGQLRSVAPLSLLSFKACCDVFSLGRRCPHDISNKLQPLFANKSSSKSGDVTEGRCSKGSKVSPVIFSPLDESGKLHAFFKKHVKPKKQHEIKSLGQVIYLLSEHIKCDTVIDVGSGLGHLARLLSFGYNLQVTSVEAAGTHAPKATKYDREIDREIKKKMQSSQGSSVVSDDISLPCHVTSMIFPNMSAEEFLAIIKSQQKPETSSENLRTGFEGVSVGAGKLIKDVCDPCNTSSDKNKRDGQEIEPDCSSVKKYLVENRELCNNDDDKLNLNCDSLNECLPENLHKLYEEGEVMGKGIHEFTRKDICTSETNDNELQTDCDSLNKCADEESLSVENADFDMESRNDLQVNEKEKQLFKRMKYTKQESDPKLIDADNESKEDQNFYKSKFGESSKYLDISASDKPLSDTPQTDSVSPVKVRLSRNQNDHGKYPDNDFKNQSKTTDRIHVGNNEERGQSDSVNDNTIKTSDDFRDGHKSEGSRQVDASEWHFLLTGLHACGDLTPTFLRFFVSCDAAVGLASVGCCYMKISDKSCSDKTVGYPMSEYVASLPNHRLSYASRELACHFADTYSQRLKECPPLLKIHSYRAALEWIANKLCPDFKRTAVQILTKKTNNLQFDKYIQLGLQKLGIPAEQLSDDLFTQAFKMTERWKDVVAFYTIRLALAPVVETLVLLDRLMFLYEKGYTGAILPVFDPELSPRNFVLLSWKDVK